MKPLTLQKGKWWEWLILGHLIWINIAFRYYYYAENEIEALSGTVIETEKEIYYCLGKLDTIDIELKAYDTTLNKLFHALGVSGTAYEIYEEGDYIDE